MVGWSVVICALARIFWRGKSMQTVGTRLSSLPIGEAAALWIGTRKPFLSPRTVEDYEHYIETLAFFFGETRLSEITGDHIRAYQAMRQLRAGASCINKECSLVQQMLKRIGRWSEIEFTHD